MKKDTVRYTNLILCPVCKGVGKVAEGRFKKTSRFIKCGYCNGLGRITEIKTSKVEHEKLKI